ncbi:oxidoreductase [Schizosaccharomyces cryophilus OY26]|uniref:Oxidoreductase n=1 Tax=Schizosaccharomyces cryophilus (strain OY26 / ATCC MYA-4695 / CBS 11777 / NBRC 106824 / NRRL Y48691) TaxID=653667 RepID=S9W1U2_SCHCR|nr:oxidoreductase [Schizosaccharomyces cryophilus OY26]EPY51995.1 oxidoreductase [Schizosaccharomyces cryophilus OY26]
MSMDSKLRVLSVGSNAISAFIGWRLSESKACHTSLVWRNRSESVMSEGIRIRSSVFGSTKWKPDVVVPTIEQLVTNNEPFDYVFVCLKIIPSVYDLGTAIKDVVTPGHTCVVLNTTGIVGVEKALQDTFPNNSIISFVIPDQFAQRGPMQFEHTAFAADTASSVMYLGLTDEEDEIPDSVQDAMIETLTLTLEAGGVSCSFLPKIQQKQWETGIGHMAFFPISILNDEPNLSLIYKASSFVKVIDGIMNEALSTAVMQGCDFPLEKQDSLKRFIVNRMLAAPRPSYIYQDYLAHRPLEVEVLLGYPVQIANQYKVSVPYMETIFALFEAKAKKNLTSAPAVPHPIPAVASSRISPVGLTSRSPSRSTVGTSTRMSSVDDLMNKRQFASSPASQAPSTRSMYKIPSASMVNLSSPVVTSSADLGGRAMPTRFTGRNMRGSPFTMNKAGSVSDILSMSDGLVPNDPSETASVAGGAPSFDMLTLTQRRNRRNSQMSSSSMGLPSSAPSSGDRRYTWTGRPPPPNKGFTEPVIPILEDPMTALYDTSRYPTRPPGSSASSINGKSTPKASRPPSIASTSTTPRRFG